MSESFIKKNNKKICDRWKARSRKVQFHFLSHSTILQISANKAAPGIPAFLLGTLLSLGQRMRVPLTGTLLRVKWGAIHNNTG